MSQATKRKHVVKQVMEEYIVPSEQQQIVKVTRSPGNNLHEVETAEGERFLVSMPTKFRKNIWIKRGDFVIVDPIEEGEKVKAEITFILYKDHISHLKKEGLWPNVFSDSVEEPFNTVTSQTQLEHSSTAQDNKDSSDEDDSEDDDDDLFVNTNRVNYEYSESEDDSEEEESEEEEK
ncbi:probable RNA-binding protein EIF1AD [Latimeria chalumnae]|uniref:Probable RNA-binding protein EIF1AD n=1 Tax=Latimeria chalumnae TaxID=7897 RepID=H3ATQ2_LATCH|nr:PREDICTED: probable RNA-binding protein EIF1AD [Latimeria chalumnae]XP_014347782.1 PREDICTED: probable RNA-binding protein EIF1AD [Latimeria chalumnae]|eukprot:XP_006002516.1 PREDICTED: probable RNA-binding protein EIF1AD [Latimeria chalumnae]